MLSAILNMVTKHNSLKSRCKSIINVVGEDYNGKFKLERVKTKIILSSANTRFSLFKGPLLNY